MVEKKHSLQPSIRIFHVMGLASFPMEKRIWMWKSITSAFHTDIQLKRSIRQN